MGIMTLQNFRDDLKDALGRPTVDANRLDRWVNNALFEFGHAFEFPELEKVGSINTVAGQRSYDVPADFRAMHDNGVRIVTPQDRFGGTLVNESRRQYLMADRYDTGNARGVVGAYHMYQKKIWVRPAPDGTATAIEFDYWAKVTKLTNPTDVTVFDEDWDEILFRGALYRGHLAYGEHDRVQNVFNLFLADIRSRVMATDLQEFPEGGISALQSSYDTQIR